MKLSDSVFQQYSQSIDSHVMILLLFTPTKVIHVICFSEGYCKHSVLDVIFPPLLFLCST